MATKASDGGEHAGEEVGSCEKPPEGDSVKLELITGQGNFWDKSARRAKQ